MRPRYKRILAAAVLICVIAALLLSAFLISAHADHDCTGEHCPICVQIHRLQDILKTVSSACLGAFLIFSTGFSCVFFAALKNRYVKNTLFGQRIRLNI